MARPSSTAPIDYEAAHSLTHGLLKRAACPDGRPFVLVKDADKKGLRMRVTRAGGKHWQFETRLRSGKLFTRALGEWPAVSIVQAQEEAHRLRGLTEKGIDPRDVEREQAAAKAAAEAEKASRAAADIARAAADAITTREVWDTYLAERRPHWGELHYLSHLEKASPGGQESRQRGMAGKLTKPGPLASLLALPLKDLNAATIEQWAAREGKDRPSSARLAHRQLSVFLNWCAEQPQYASLVPDGNPARTKRTRESLGKQGVKDDVLTREQLPAWFKAVRQIRNPVIAAALQCMLLTGARPGEILGLRWADVDTQWNSLAIRDKVEGERTIPLTPYVSSLLAGLPHRNEWVFSATRTLRMDAHNLTRRSRKAAARGKSAPEGDVQETSASGRISKPNAPHTRACAVAGINDLTLHGLRRSFATLTEWLETPAGVVAQIQGHKPSATAEKHYKRRPLDLLRVHHTRIEAWILKQAGVEFDAKAPPAAALKSISAA